MTRATKRDILNYEEKIGGDDATSPDSIDGEAAQALATYMEQSYSPPDTWKRSSCCGSSSFMYCSVCYRLLVPQEDWPLPLQDGSLQLPFDLHILLEDRQTQSSGVQVKSVLDAASGVVSGNAAKNDKEEKEEFDEGGSTSSSRVKIYNLETGDMPPYSDSAIYDGTYLLFPGTDSIPISKLLEEETTKIKSLVVLDCRWSRSSSRFHPDLASLPKVSLDHPPAQSYYWRWHNTGVGMLSTAEAIYFAAWQILTKSLDGNWTLEERQGRLVHLLYLFRLQRALIERKYAQNQVRGVNPHVPFTEEAKEFSRKLRSNQKNKEKQKLRQQEEELK